MSFPPELIYKISLYLDDNDKRVLRCCSKLCLGAVPYAGCCKRGYRLPVLDNCLWCNNCYYCCICYNCSGCKNKLSHMKSNRCLNCGDCIGCCICEKREIEFLHNLYREFKNTI